MSFFTGVVGAARGLQPTFRQDFTKSEVFDPRITFSRNSIATRFNSSGMLETLSANQARFDYDPVTLVTKGLLLEESRQDVLLQSVDLNNVTWTKTDCTVTNNSYINDNSIIFSNVAYGSTGELTQTVTVTGGTYSFSLNLKYVNTRWVRIMLWNTGSNNSRVWVDVLNGIIGTITNAGTVTLGSATIVSRKNGVIRVQFSANVPHTSLSTYVVLADSNGSNSKPSSGELLIANPQLEIGSYPTSYIPTTTAAVTRQADNCRITGSNLTSFYNASEGTFVYEFSYEQNSSDIFFLTCFNDSNNYFAIRRVNNDLRLIVRKTGSSNGDFTIKFNALTGMYRVVFSYDVSSFSACVSGGTIYSGAANMVTSPSSVYLGSLAGSPNNIINARYLAYYPKAIPSDQLQKLSSLV